MQFNADTPRTEATIAGETYTVPQPFAEGHQLNANEAAALNQLLVENVRNNFAARVKKDPEAKPAQADLDSYVSDYEFGVRRGGGGAPKDPVEAEARNIAREKIKEKLREKGIPLKDVPATRMTELVDEVMTKHGEPLRKKAAQIVKQRQGIASEEFEVNV